MSDYPHRLRISRGGASPGGSQDDDGVWVDNPGADDDSEVYNDLADVQDAGRTLERDNLASPTVKSDAVAFLKNEKAIKNIKVGDTAEITWEDGTKDQASVSKVRRLDSSVMLRYL